MRRFLPGREPDDKSLMRPGNQKVVWAVLLVLAAVWAWGMLQGTGSAVTIPYSEFRQQIEAGNVEQVTLEGDEVRGSLMQTQQTEGPGGQPVSYSEFVTYVPSFGDEQLLSQLEEKGVVVRTVPEDDTPWTAILMNLLPILILVWIGLLVFRRMQSQGQNLFGMGKSRAKPYERGTQETSFGDVAGLEGAKVELEEIVAFLKEPERLQRLGGEVPRGVLLQGPPGTGKTLLARAVAGEAEVPFFSVTGSDFMEMLVGVGASRVRDMFNDAKESSPSIIFIDELDSIGRRRGAGIGGGHDEREQTLNQLLSEMDGFEPTESVVVMAATNRPDILDPALLRPGRFDRQVTIDLPTRKARLAILRIHARNKTLADDVDLQELAAGTPGFSGADLKNLLNEAALLAARKDKEAIEPSDIEAARDKVLMGLERENLALEEDEIRLLAYHESGHACLAALLPHADPLHKVTIIPRGQAMGVTQQLPEREQYIYLKSYLDDRLAVILGGRAAEEIVYDSVSSGAANDLQQATKLARRMVLQWGMSERFGPMSLGEGEENVFLGRELAQRRQYSDETAREVDEEIQSILDAAFERARSTLEEHREGLEALVEELIQVEEVSGDRVLEILGVDPEALEDSERALVAPPSTGGGAPVGARDQGE